MKSYILLLFLLLLCHISMAQAKLTYQLNSGSGTEICVNASVLSGIGSCMQSGDVVIIIDNLPNGDDILDLSITSGGSNWSVPSNFPFVDIEGSETSVYKFISNSLINLNSSVVNLFCFEVFFPGTCQANGSIGVSIADREATDPLNTFILDKDLTNTAGTNDCSDGNIDGSSYENSSSSGTFPLVCPTATPVELTAFTAEPQSDKSALLQWQTATEINNDYFQIEHSINGVDFRAVGKERGAGTTDQVQDYKFIHRKPVNGSNYYRLMQVDFDGTFEYSPVEVVYFDEDRSEITNFKIFPNPSDSYLMILPPGTKKTPWNVDVFDIQGKLMNQFIIRDDQYRLDTADWPTGIYHIQIQGDNRTEQYRFVKD